jgi:hypothetical protein
VQHRTDTAHSRSRSITQGVGAMTVHQGGATAVAVHPDAAEPAVARRAQPWATAHQPEATAQAQVVRVRSQPLSVGSSSSRHHCVEHCGAEIQSQVGAPA